MCIILGEVTSVSQTKLFGLVNKTKTRQMTFYSNAVDSPNENMMILPVPCSNGTIELHDIKYKGLFNDLKQSVRSTREDPTSGYLTRSLAVSASLPAKTLDIKLVGSYYVSIAPQLEDLLRLNTSVFDLTPEVYEFFGNHYTREFSYLCCVLRPGMKGYEPLCYSHPLHSSGKMFLPTLHYHNHGDHVETDDADWDHLVYSVGTSEKANYGFTSNYENNVDWTHFPSDFQKLRVNSVRCAKIQGHQKNTDIAFELW
jgi:hypothetical protein